ncbi:MAG TPA: tetratricopeptide repeat protein [Candidatus Limnocylindria bacterium]|nr:tetratricopeptide repeat protein [Candidatus Limnocylindria bacterium]
MTDVQRGLVALLATVDEKLAQDAGDAALHFARAQLLDELGRYEAATRAYLDVLVRERTHRGAMVRVATLFLTAGSAELARAIFAEAVSLDPDDAVARVGLGSALLEQDDLAGARREFEAAVRSAPSNRDAHCGLAMIHERCDERAAADREWRLAFPSGTIAVSQYRGAAPPVRVLLIVSALRANVSLQRLLDDRVFQWATLFAESYVPTIALPPHDVVFNAIGDADSRASVLEVVEQVLARTCAPVLNHPARVRTTGRADVAARLREIPHVVTPRIAAIPREQLTAERLTAHGFSFPLLLRSPGFHTGEHFARVDDAAALAAVAATLPGAELLAIEYLDTRRPDGSVRKYRVMTVAGRLYPLHLAISRDWKVHYFSSAMGEDAAFRAEEERFLDDMEEALGVPAVRALEAIAHTLALDYGGIDFALDVRGRVVVFEANATMVIARPQPDERWTYRRAPTQRVVEAVQTMITTRAHASTSHASTGAA